MKLNLILSIIVFILISGTNAFAKKQKIDTLVIMYSSDKVRSVETYDKKGKEPKTLISFFSEEGEDLLKEKDFTYSYVDERMKMKREVNVQDYRIVSEYFIDGNDTIYICANFDKALKKQVKKFIEYTTKNIRRKFPKDMEKCQIQRATVIAYFIVDKQGNIVYIDTQTDVGCGLDAVVRKLIRDYKHWGVVTIDKKPVNFYLVFKQPFKIDL